MSQLVEKEAAGCSKGTCEEVAAVTGHCRGKVYVSWEEDRATICGFR